MCICSAWLEAIFKEAQCYYAIEVWTEFAQMFLRIDEPS